MNKDFSIEYSVGKDVDWSTV